MKLLPHQIEDALFLASSFGTKGNFSGMGSGKTLTALEAVNLLGKPKTIIICPPIALSMWMEVWEEWVQTPLQYLKTGKTPLQPQVNAFIMTYDIARVRVHELKGIDAEVLVCDEAHALKSITAKRTKAILGNGGLVESVDYSWMLTGTPSTRWSDDLYPFLVRAGADQLKQKIGGLSFDKFRLRYCVTQQKTYGKPKGNWRPKPVTVTVGNRNTDELNDMLFKGGLAVRHELAEVWAQMPPITINHLKVGLEMTPEWLEIRQRTKGLTTQQIMAGLQSNEPEMATMRRVLGRAKVKAAVHEIIERIEDGIKPILVGAWHTEVIDALEITLAEYSVGVIDGRTSGPRRDILVKQFNDGRLDVLVGQIASMGVAINMQGGSHIICVEQDWSPAIMAQFYARCHRIGQPDHVHVDLFESDSTLDEAIRMISSIKAREHSKLMEQ